MPGADFKARSGRIFFQLSIRWLFAHYCVKVVGDVSVAGCHYTPARPEEIAAKLSVYAAFNIIGMDQDGVVLDDHTMREVMHL